MSQQFCLKWNNHMNVMKEFEHFLSIGIMVDVTLACDGQSLKAHKIVLSACSPFFRSLFLENPCKHPIVILKDVKYTELKAIINFMYRGEVNVAGDQLSALIKTAQTLRVKGLGEELSESVKNVSPSYECDNQSGDESENQSEDELSNLSVCTLDVANETFSTEMKQEVLSNDTKHSASYSSAVTMSLLSDPNNSNFFDSQQEKLVEKNKDKCAAEKKFQDSTQNLVEQSDSFPEQPFESSPESNMQQPQNFNDSSSSSISETSIYMLSSALTVDNEKSGTSSAIHGESLQKKEELKKIPTKMSAKKIPLRKSVRKRHNLRKSEVISNDVSNPKKVVDEVEDSESPISKTKFHKSLKKHYNAYHGETGQFKCKKCTFATASKSQLVHHIELVHQAKPYHCSLCTYKAATTVGLKKHIESVHEVKKPFKCEKCDFCTAENKNLKRHMIRIHGKGEKKLTCPHCSYQSHRRDNLNNHLKVHRKKK